MHKKYRVRLTDVERTDLIAVTGQQRVSARRRTRAQMLLLADRGATDRAIAEAFATHPRTVERLRQRAVEEGVEAALSDRSRPGAARKLSPSAEALLVAEACATPPAGREHWTMQLLADRLVDLKLVTSISDETVRRTLQKTTSSPGSSSSGASRP